MHLGAVALALEHFSPHGEQGTALLALWAAKV